MSNETKIKYISGASPRVDSAAENARRILKETYSLNDLGTGLDQQMFGGGETLYLNPTEKNIISSIVSSGDTFATVLGSGDFAIEAGRAGAKEILTFDINPHQYNPAALKLAALQNMPYDTFFSFLSDAESPNWLSSDSYKNLKRVAQKDPALFVFFDEIIKTKDRDYREMQDFVRKHQILKNLINSSEYSIVGLYAMILMYRVRLAPPKTLSTLAGLANKKAPNTYLENERTYLDARRAILDCRISFLNANLTELGDRLRKSGWDKEPFDSMYLSNIPQFINGELFGKTVSEQLMPMLEDNGCIAFCYQGTSIRTLEMNDERLAAQRNKLAKAAPDNKNIVHQQLLNSVVGYRALKEGFDIELNEEDTLSKNNGLGSKDTFAYVRKRKR